MLAIIQHETTKGSDPFEMVDVRTFNKLFPFYPYLSRYFPVSVFNRITIYAHVRFENTTFIRIDVEQLLKVF